MKKRLFAFVLAGMMLFGSVGSVYAMYAVGAEEAEPPVVVNRVVEIDVARWSACNCAFEASCSCRPFG